MPRVGRTLRRRQGGLRSSQGI
ncbi:hypothetical protein A2U01_0062691, partial [Trifolium medium]|nr:hypothetical protein [Trifolium medium]